MPSTALYVHVPVDRFDITNGPSSTMLVVVSADLAALNRDVTPPYDDISYIEVEFTLRTGASCLTFRRTLMMRSIFDVEDDVSQFRAVFAGQVVSGVYNMQTLTGWFNLD